MNEQLYDFLKRQRQKEKDDISDSQKKIVKTMADDLTGSGDLIKHQDQLIAVSEYLADKRDELSAIYSDIDNIINEIMLEEDY